MKKVFALLLAGCLALGLLAGCGGSDSSGSTGSGAAPGSSNAGGGDGENIIINVYDWDAGFDTSIIDRFNEQNPGITAVFNTVPDNNEKITKLDILAMGGGEVDVMPMPDGDQFLRMQNGLLAPIDQFIEADGIDMVADYGPHAEWAMYDGSYYGLPLRVNIEAVFYNKDMFDAAGEPYPSDDWTYEDYIETARRMTSGEGPDKVYGTYTHTWSGVWNNISAQADSYYTADGMCNFDNPAFRMGLETRRMLDEEGVQQSYSQITAVNAMPNSAFLGGQCAMATVGSWLVRDMKDAERFPFDFEVGWTYMPRFNESSGAKPANTSVSLLCIPATSKNPEAAWKFLRFYVEENAKAIAASGNIPCYQPAYDDELIETYIEGSGLDMEYARKIFASDITTYSSKVGVPPDVYLNGPQYDILADEEVQLYLNGEQDLDTTMANVVEKVNKMIEEEG